MEFRNPIDSSLFVPEEWKRALSILEANADIPAQQFELWLKPLQWIGQSIDSQQRKLKVTLGVEREIQVTWIKMRFMHPLEDALSRTLGQSAYVELVPIQNTALNSKSSDSTETSSGSHDGSHCGDASNPLSMQDLSAFLDVKETARVLPDPAKPRVSLHASYPITNPAQPNAWIDARYTFESFVVGPSNQFAHATALAVANKPGSMYNPFIVYAQPGLGKTHLLHAIGNWLVKRNPAVRVCYVQAIDFVNEYIQSIPNKTTYEFQKKYRESYDVIMMDDIQFLAGKERSVEEFFHMFNSLYNTRRQIILTCDRPPKEIGLEDRIQSRLGMGLIADVQPPEIETRIAILKSKAERDDIYLPDEVATFLATHVKSNVRELEGLLIRLQAHASITGAEITLELAKQQLKLALPEESNSFTIENIQSTVVKYFGIKLSELKSPKRTKTIALARQIAVYLIRKYTSLTYDEIGRHFGGKDHTTLIHACEKIEAGIEERSEIRKAVEAIQAQL